MPTLREAAEAALRWIETHCDPIAPRAKEQNLMEGLRAALAAPEPDKDRATAERELTHLQAEVIAIRSELEIGPCEPLLEGVRRVVRHHHKVVCEATEWRERAEWLLGALRGGCDD